MGLTGRKQGIQCTCSSNGLTAYHSRICSAYGGRNCAIKRHHDGAETALFKNAGRFHSRYPGGAGCQTHPCRVYSTEKYGCYGRGVAFMSECYSRSEAHGRRPQSLAGIYLNGFRGRDIDRLGLGLVCYSLLTIYVYVQV